MATVTSRTSRKQSAEQGEATVESVARPSDEPSQSIEELRAMLVAQQAQIAQMAATIQQLTQPMQTPVEIVEADDATDQNASDETPVARKATSRRGLLKWGGLGAAAALAAAAGTAGLSRTTAHAADGDSLILGQLNGSTSQTTWINTSADTVLLSIAGGNGGSSFAINAVSGTSGNGVLGQAFGSAGYGVIGQGDSGWGVRGITSTGIDLAAVGTGRLFQELSGFTGAPTSGSYFTGEQIRDEAGDLYICVAGGSPGTWRRVAAGVPGVSGSVNFLAKPIRLLDTRTGSPWTAGSNHTVQVTGVSVGGISVPSGAVGVIGNVTVVGPTSDGDLRLYPAGASLPATSSINFASGQTIANGVTIGLSSGGALAIQVDMSSGAHTNVLFDASGYIL